MILTKNLYGLDICDRAAQLAQLAVIMKAREYDKDISSKVVELNITSIQDTNWFDPRVKECLMNDAENQLLAQEQIDLLQNTFKDAKEYGSIIDVKDFDFEVIKNPGHTFDSVSYYFKDDKVMFVGDFIFKDSVGRCDLPGGSKQELEESLEKIKSYPADVTLYPGHYEITTLGEEMKNNSYFR